MFYSTSLFAKTFSETFDVDLGEQLTVKTDVGSIKIETHNEATIEMLMNFLIVTNYLMGTKLPKH